MPGLTGLARNPMRSTEKGWNGQEKSEEENHEASQGPNTERVPDTLAKRFVKIKSLVLRPSTEHRPFAGSSK